MQAKGNYTERVKTYLDSFCPKEGYGVDSVTFTYENNEWYLRAFRPSLRFSIPVPRSQGVRPSPEFGHLLRIPDGFPNGWTRRISSMSSTCWRYVRSDLRISLAMKM